MKKINIIFLLLICILISGCGSNKETKVAGTLSDFNNNAINNSFTVNDNMNSYQSINYIIGSMVASKDDITVEMVIYDTTDNAIKAQDNQIKAFQNMKSANSTTKKDKGENFYKYVYVSNGYYMITSRIDNTLIFSKTLLTNKELVDNIINSMNY